MLLLQEGESVGLVNQPDEASLQVKVEAMLQERVEAGWVGVLGGLYQEAPYVADLTPSQFSELVRESPSLVLVQFYRESCSACQRIKPKYTRLSESASLRVVAVNCERFPAGCQGLP